MGEEVDVLGATVKALRVKMCSEVVVKSHKKLRLLV